MSFWPWPCSIPWIHVAASTGRSWISIGSAPLYLRPQPDGVNLSLLHKLLINSVRHLSAVPVILIAALHIDTKPPCSIAAYLQTFPPLYFPRDFVLRLSLSKAGKPAKCRACGGLPSQGKALRPVILVKSRTQTGELPDSSPGVKPPTHSRIDGHHRVFPFRLMGGHRGPQVPHPTKIIGHRLKRTESQEKTR